MANSAVNCLILVVYYFNMCFSDLGISLQAEHTILLMFLFFAISAGWEGLNVTDQTDEAGGERDMALTKVKSAYCI